MSEEKHAFENPATRDLEFDLGEAGPGQSMVFSMSKSVFIQVMDEENFKKYAANEEFTAFRGQIHSSPHRFKFPRKAHWFCVVTPSTFFGVSDFKVRVMSDAVLDSKIW